MGVSNHTYKKIVDVIKNNLSSIKDKKVLCLGYPDLLVDEKTLVSIYGNDFVKSIPEDSCANEIRVWHKSTLPKIYDALYLLEHHGFEVTIFDTFSHRNIETIVDLNEPISEEFFNKFDLIIDTGTLEHCFNVGTAFKNVCSTVKVGGIFMTAAPMTKLNHGYWNFGTIVHYDGFTQNGFEILDRTFYNRGIEIPLEKITPKSIPLKSVATCIAKKIKQQDWIWPIQGKYK